MGLINLLINDPQTFILLTVPLLYSIIFHELAHGYVAYRLGDPTASWLGRLSLNPLKHLDPIGTLMLFVVGFGWAKPVPINPKNISDQRRGLLLVSSAGIITNFLLAFIALFLFRILEASPGEVLGKILFYTAQINIILAAFNAIPLPPLDGSKILMGFLSPRNQYLLARIEPYGLFILIGLMFIGALDPLIRLFRWIILRLLAVIL